MSDEQDIASYLRQGETQARIWQSIQNARENITVTISRAASLFGFSESKLREWEKRGLLQADRSIPVPEGKSATGHRQYSQADLNKLALIRDLLDHGYGLGEIPPHVDQIWTEIVGEAGALPGAGATSLAARTEASRRLPIDERVEQTDRQEFWRYFVAQSLRLSLAFICEDVPDTAVAGLILPLQRRLPAPAVTTTDELARLGPSLVGWQGPDGSFYTFLDDAPTFAYPSDFRLERLTTDDSSSGGDEVLANLYVVVQRRARQSLLSSARVGAIRRLLAQIVAHREDWRVCFEYGRHDWLYQVHNLLVPGESTILRDLLERVIELSGTTAEGQKRWNYCVLLLPDDTSLPLQQQSLVARAQTRNSPYETGITTISAQHTGEANSLTLRAFQSGQIVSVPAALSGESMTHPLHLQVITSTPQSIASGKPARPSTRPAPGEAVHSALAVPVVGEHGISMAALYIEANGANAFSQEDQRVLRMIGRMIEELLKTSQARNQMPGRRSNLIERPALVDPTFDEFAAESDFISEIDALLSRIQEQGLTEGQRNEQISLISIDIDNQSSIAMKYGNRVARNLSQQVGLRIRGQMSVASRFHPNQLFHISADKYYLLLEGVTLESAQQQARQLRDTLSGSYLILPTSATPSRPAQPINMLELPGVTVHIGVSSYLFSKLDELLWRYATDTAKIYVRTLIIAGIEEMLERGKNAGGNCVISWDRESWGYKPLR